MKFIFTLSGNSERFTKEGFISKPLIKIDDRYVIEYVLDMYPGIDFKDVTFVVNDQDVKNHKIDEVLGELYPLSTVLTIPAHRKGPVVSLLRIEDSIQDDEPYIVSYCDLTHKWNYQNFLQKIKDTNCDGCLVTHTGTHPHRMRNINFAHLKLDSQGFRVLGVKEKGYYTDVPILEHASSGIYYFKSGNILKTYCRKMVENDERVNGEFYVTLIYNGMIKDGMYVIDYLTDNYVCLGTPFDLIQFKYWKSLINNKITQEEVEFIQNYWRTYHDIDKKQT
jgi:NDP-sugar pyrophosphorylase family protein